MRARLASLLLALAVILGAGPGAPVPALAQVDTPMVRPNAPSIFDALFGRRPPRQAPVASDPSNDRRAGGGGRSETRVTELPKVEGAKKILVIGDSLAGNIADGLVQAFADTPDVSVVSRTRPLSGLVRADYHDWSVEAPKVIGEVQPDFVVVMIGGNDRQPVYDGEGRVVEDIQAPGWEKHLKDRAGAFADALVGAGRPTFWVGLPPANRTEFSAFLAWHNERVRPIVEGKRLFYVDIWPSFTDDEGRYTPMGADVDGTVKRLRATDGVHFNRAGQRKLAWFVETEIRRVLGGEEVPAPAPEAAAEPAPEAPLKTAAPWALPPAPWETVGPVTTLTEIAADRGEALAGGPQAPRPGAKPAATTVMPAIPGADRGYPYSETPAYRRLVRGEGIGSRAGRVDDFAWPRPPAPTAPPKPQAAMEGSTAVR